MIYNLNDCKSSNKYYGGNAGIKKGIIFNGRNWFIKLPQSTRGNRVQEISYTTSPLSEYIGFNIYKILGFPVHETELGVYNGKVVVMCKDFLRDGDTLVEFNKVKNAYFPGIEDILTGSSSGSSTDLEEIEIIFENNEVFMENIDAIERFWDMFVVDALIGNKDRNNGNWGFIESKGKLKLAPVYDNGNSFANKAGDIKMQMLLSNEGKLRNSALVTGVCIFSINGRPVNHYKYISDADNDSDLAKAILRVAPKININNLLDFIDSIPEGCYDTTIISDVRREYYKKLLLIRYEECLLPVYNRLLSSNRILSLIKSLMEYEDSFGGNYPFALRYSKLSLKQKEDVVKGCIENKNGSDLYKIISEVVGRR